MGKRAVNPPALAAWLTQSRNRSKAQYASEIRHFLTCRGAAWSASTSDELLDFILGLRDSRRRRATSALMAFFEFTTSYVPLSRDPAIGLWDRVRDASSDQQTELDLRSAGLADPSELRWRDVGVIGLLGDRKPADFTGQLPATDRVMVALFERLIMEIRETPPSELEDFLDSRVVGTR